MKKLSICILTLTLIAQIAAQNLKIQSDEIKRLDGVQTIANLDICDNSKLIISRGSHVVLENMNGSKTSIIEVESGGNLELKPQTYHFKILHLRKDALVSITGTTHILINKLITDGESRISYKKGSAFNVPGKNLNLNIADGSAINGVLSVVGSGKDGADGTAGTNGNNGEEEHTRVEVKLTGPRVHIVKPTNGGNGKPGNSGANGESGLHVTVNVLKLGQRGFVRIVSNGGNGGNGGRGGNGGHGGRGKRFKRGGNGGNGGSGGNGGHGGNGGVIKAYMVLYTQSEDPEVCNKHFEEQENFLKNNIIANPGLGGSGGLPGEGGNAGNGGPGAKGPVWKRGSGGGGDTGHPGVQGEMGRTFEKFKEIKDLVTWRLENAKVLEGIGLGKE